MPSTGKQTTLKTQLRQALHNPFQLRMIITGLIVVVGYVAVYMPLSNDIAETQVMLTTSQKRLQLTKDVVSLRAQFKLCQPRLPNVEKGVPDSNEWIQHLLAGLRKLPVNLLTMDFRPQRDIGPYKAIVVHISIEGTFQDLHAVLCWLETNERLYRVDEFNLVPVPQGRGNNLLMELTVLGMMG